MYLRPSLQVLAHSSRWPGLSVLRDNADRCSRPLVEVATLNLSHNAIEYLDGARGLWKRILHIGLYLLKLHEVTLGGGGEKISAK